MKDGGFGVREKGGRTGPWKIPSFLCSLGSARGSLLIVARVSWTRSTRLSCRLRRRGSSSIRRRGCAAL